VRRTGALAGLAAAALTPSRLSLGRAGAGTLMLVRPTGLGQLMGVRPQAAAETAFAVQMLGAREIALGLGGYLSLRRGDARASRLWLAAGLLSDAVDALAVAGAVGRGRVATAPGVAAVAVATTAAAVQAAALAER
jgi:hypothetical protein